MDNLKRLTRHLDSVSEHLGSEDQFSAEELGALRALKDAAPAEPLSLEKVDRLQFFGKVSFAAAAALIGIGLGVWAGYSLIDDRPDVNPAESSLTEASPATGSPAEPSRRPGETHDSRWPSGSRAAEIGSSEPPEGSDPSFLPDRIPNGRDSRPLPVSRGLSPGAGDDSAGALSPGLIEVEDPASVEVRGTMGIVQDRPPTKQEIEAALASPDSQLRHNTWKRLDPEDSYQYRVLLTILGKLNWYDRSAAVEALSRASSETTLGRMTRSALKDSHPFVRQGLCEALALTKDPRHYATLYEALKDKHPYVRRMVVYSLGFVTSEANVNVLIELFLTEKDPVVRAFLESSLNHVTQAYQGPDAATWQRWWDRARSEPGFELGKTDEELLRQAERLGGKLKESSTQVAAVHLDTSERGAGPPILILPHYGYTKDTMLPFLSELEKNHKLIYMDLPPIKAFDGLPSVSAGKIASYPIDRLVEAFEALRKKSGKTRFAIMACGVSSWIAMRYAKLYPESVAAMILVAPLSGSDEYGNATKRLVSLGLQRRDREMHFLGLSRTFDRESGESTLEIYHRENNIPKTTGEALAISRRKWSLHFKEERDGLLAMLYPKAPDPDASTVAVPSFDLKKEERPASRVPVLVISGERDLFASVADGKLIADYYGGKHVVFKNSACMPFAEESPEFNETVGNFLKTLAKRKPTSVANRTEGADQAPPFPPAGEPPVGTHPAGGAALDPEAKVAFNRARLYILNDSCRDLEQEVRWALERNLRSESREIVKRILRIYPKYQNSDDLKKSVAIVAEPVVEVLSRDRELLARRLRMVGDRQARRLYSLALKCFKAGLFTGAYNLLHDILEVTPDPNNPVHTQARKVLGYAWDGKEREWITEWEADRRRTHYLTDEGWVRKTDRLKWARGLRPLNGDWVTAREEEIARTRNLYNPYVVDTEHFRVRTHLGRKQAFEYARILESFHGAFYRVFISYYDQVVGPKLLFRRPRAVKHAIHVFPSRVEYLNYLAERGEDHELLKRSAGIYNPRDQVSYLYWADDDEDMYATLFHEVAHQLFAESKPTRPGSTGNHWLPEGLGTYVETWLLRDGEWSPGKRTNAARLQTAREILRRRSDDFTVGRFVSTGYEEFHHPDVRGDNYALSCALTHFFMHYEGGLYREEFMRFVSAYYAGRAHEGSLGESIRVESADGSTPALATLDEQFKSYVRNL